MVDLRVFEVNQQFAHLIYEQSYSCNLSITFIASYHWRIEWRSSKEKHIDSLSWQGSLFRFPLTPLSYGICFCRGGCRIISNRASESAFFSPLSFRFATSGGPLRTPTALFDPLSYHLSTLLSICSKWGRQSRQIARKFLFDPWPSTTGSLPLFIKELYWVVAISW